MVAHGNSYGSVSTLSNHNHHDFFTYPSRSSGFDGFVDGWVDEDEDTPLVGSRAPLSPRSTVEFPSAGKMKSMFRNAVSRVKSPMKKNPVALPHGVTVSIAYNLDSASPKVCHVKCNPTTINESRSMLF